MPDENDIIFESYSVDVLAIARSVYDFFTGNTIGFDSVVNFFDVAWSVWTVLAYVLSFIFMAIYIYAFLRYVEVSEQETKNVDVAEEAWRQLYGSHTGNDRWTEIQQHISSDSPADWKVAIIEADIMLEKMLDEKGFAGQTIADQLRSASPTNFTTIQDAWAAHKIRNKVAHGSEDFVLTYKIARETITQYRRVFEEFGVI